MNGTVVARVRRVMFGHSERALVHAVDDDGLEYKIEVPSDTMKDVAAGGDYTLTLTWAVAPAAVKVPAAGATSPPQVPTPLPSSVDEKFMRLMGRPGGRVQATMAGTTQSQIKSGEPMATAAEQLAQRLGIPSSRTAG